MLYNLNQEQLSSAIFPLSDISKDETREYAKKLGMIVAEKPDSQEICFVEDNDYARFIHQYSGEKPQKGNFVDKNGNILGSIMIIHYTIGQAKDWGLRLKANVCCRNRSKEQYCYIGGGEELFSDTLYAKDVNYIPLID